MSVMSLALVKPKMHCFAACFIYLRGLNLCYNAIKTFDASIVDVQGFSHTAPCVKTGLVRVPHGKG